MDEAVRSAGENKPVVYDEFEHVFIPLETTSFPIGQLISQSVAMFFKCDFIGCKWICLLTFPCKEFMTTTNSFLSTGWIDKKDL